MTEPQFVNADAARVEFARPAVIVGGRRYVGRILSYDEFAPFQEGVEAARKGKMTEAMLVDFFRAYSRAIFRKPPWWPPDGWSWRQWRLERRYWRGDPTAALMQLPPATMVSTFLGFFVCQRHALEPQSKKIPTNN